MSGSFYALSADPMGRRLVFSMGLGLRLGLALAWLSVTGALVPALVPGSGIAIDPEAWVLAGGIWVLVTLGLGWQDRWVFEASGRFHRDRGWLVLVHRVTEPLDGFTGWLVETHPVRALDPAGRRASLAFRTTAGQWRIDSRFRAAWLDTQKAVLDLWSSWLAEGRKA